MYRLYHHTICPFSRKVRVVLCEKMLPFTPVVENFWERRENFIKLNPMGNVPLLLARPDIIIADSQVIVEFLEEVHPQSIAMIPGSPQERAEIRRIVSWFDIKMFREVSEHILYERFFNTFKHNIAPNHSLLKIARSNLLGHMRYMEWLITRRGFLASDQVTLADITAAVHISSLDYFNEIQWEKYNVVKDWYAIIKSRPSFRNILEDILPGFQPSLHYNELDF